MGNTEYFLLWSTLKGISLVHLKVNVYDNALAANKYKVSNTSLQFKVKLFVSAQHFKVTTDNVHVLAPWDLRL